LKNSVIGALVIVNEAGDKNWKRAKVEEVDLEEKILKLYLIDSGESYSLPLGEIASGSVVGLDDDLKSREV
jgi:hypothetical protein